MGKIATLYEAKILLDLLAEILSKVNYEQLNIVIKENFPPYVNKYKFGNIKNITERYLNDFVNEIKKLDDNCFLELKKDIILSKLDFQNNRILKAIDFFLAGELIEYYTLIYDTYFNSKTELKHIYYKTIPKHSPFYRLRENQPNKYFKYNEMFHIPFEEIRRTGNQRFSLSGFPSLYLGNSTYICWEELSRPSMEKSNFSVFRNERDVHMFDITPPFEVLNERDLLRFPLGIASSIKFTDSQFPFKSEYLIPQAIFYSLMRFNKLDVKENKNIHKLDGIMYMSTLVSEELLFSDPNQMFNYVFPVSNILDDGFCTDLKGLFIISQPKTLNEISLKYPQLFFNINLDSDSEIRIDDYNLSSFYIIEEFLKGRTVKKYIVE